MCREYSNGRNPPYVRLCYRTRHKGLHLPIEPGQHWWAPNGCILKELRPSGGKRGGRSRRQTLLSFRVPRLHYPSMATAVREDVQEMARWSYCEATVKDDIVTLSTPAGEKMVKDSENIIARARTFGWEHIKGEKR